MTTSPVRTSTKVFRRLPIDQIEDEPAAGGLRRTLGLWQLTAIGVGGIIGAGIFALAGSVANYPGRPAGPSVLVSFLMVWHLAAGLGLYWAGSSGVNVLQAALLRRRVARRQS